MFLAFAGLLLAVGTLMVSSASMTSAPGDAEHLFAYKQLIFLMISLLAGTIASQVPAKLWLKFSPWIYLCTILALIVVLVPGWGHRVNGAQRWLKFGSLSIQPSEFIKLSLPLLICWIRFDRTGDVRPASIRQTISLLLVVAIPLGLILIEPDFGTTIFLAVVATLTLFLSRFPSRYFFCLGLVILPASLCLIALKPYQLARIQGFIQTWTHPDSAPYQVQQSLTTLGAGGLQGTGLGRGWQKLSFLPEANTDFIFSVIGEELGLLGTFGVVVLWMGLYFSGLKLIQRLPTISFEAVVATTVLTQLLLQAAMNVAVVTAMVPPKGISHPLISYGGSNLLTSVTAIGMIISLTRISTVTDDDSTTEEQALAIHPENELTTDPPPASHRVEALDESVNGAALSHVQSHIHV